jgi:hypothetical protein
MKMPDVFNGFIDASSRLDTLALFFARLLSGSLIDDVSQVPLRIGQGFTDVE